MPTPVGHALAGAATAFLSNSFARRPRLSSQVLAACVAVGVAPDLDLLVRGAHRTYTHSIGGVGIVTVISWLILRRRSRDVGASVAAIAAAHASHLFLDWLSKDTSPPLGLMILWPFSSRFYLSGADVFLEVSRRYWLVSEFVVGNLRAAAWELIVLTPVALLAWIVWSRRTLQGVRGKG